MLNNFISKYMIKKVIGPKAPSLKTARCINHLQKRQRCNLCEELCDKKAIKIESEVVIDKGKCDNCNICASICPTGNIVPTYEVIEKKYNTIAQHGDITVSCNNSDVTTELKINCIAALPWEFIVYVCLENKINLFIKNCEECSNKKLATEIKKTLSKVKFFLGEELYEKRVVFIKDEEKIPCKEYTRRDLLKLMGEQSKRLATAIAIPDDFVENKNSRIYRDLLIKKIEVIEANTNEKLNYIWPSISVSEDCWSCKVCEKLCPQTAIKIEEIGSGKGIFTHEYTKCTHCGLCKTVCLKKAINLISMESEINKKTNQYEVKLLKCSECKDPIQEDDNGMCIVCKNNKRSRY